MVQFGHRPFVVDLLVQLDRTSLSATSIAMVAGSNPARIVFLIIFSSLFSFSVSIFVKSCAFFKFFLNLCHLKIKLQKLIFLE